MFYCIRSRLPTKRLESLPPILFLPFIEKVIPTPKPRRLSKQTTILPKIEIKAESSDSFDSFDTESEEGKINP